MKKLLIVLLTVMMYFNSTLTVNILADDGNVSEQIDQQEEIVEAIDDKQEDITQEIVQESTEIDESVLVVGEQQNIEESEEDEKIINNDETETNSEIVIQKENEVSENSINENTQTVEELLITTLASEPKLEASEITIKKTTSEQIDSQSGASIYSDKSYSITSGEDVISVEVNIDNAKTKYGTSKINCTITPKKLGTAEFTVSYKKSGVEQSATYSVTVDPIDTLEFKVGDETDRKAFLTWTGDSYKDTPSIDDPNVATVTANKESGLQYIYTEPKKEGEAVVTLHGRSSDYFVEVIVTRTEIAIPSVKTDLVYDGKPKSVIDSLDSNLSFVNEGDFVSSAIAARSYKAKVKINDTDTYKWSDKTDTSKELTWTINPSTDITASITGDNVFDKPSSGEVGPTFTVVGLSNTSEATQETLVEDVDYIVSGTRKASLADDYTITITGIGNYKTETPIELNWLIIEGNIEITSADITYTNELEYAGKNIKPEDIVVTVNDIELKENEDYEIKYSETKDVGEGYSFELSAKEGSHYSTTEPIVCTYNINPADLTSASGSFSSEEYDGQSHIPTITVKGVEKDNADLVLDKDYTVKYYSNNTEISQAINAGTYKAVVTGKGNYSTASTKEVSWSITPKKLDDNAPTAKDVYYNANDQELITPQTINGVTYSYCVSTTKYTYDSALWRATKNSASESIPKKSDINTYYVYWKAVSNNPNYESTSDFDYNRNVKCEIKSLDLSKATIKLEKEELEYNGKKQTPVLDSVVASENNYKLNNEYLNINVDGNNAVNVGEYTAKVTAKASAYNYYKNTGEKKFKIVAKSVTPVWGEETTFIYKKDVSQVPTVKATDINGNDFALTVTYTDSDGQSVTSPTEIGDYIATVAFASAQTNYVLDSSECTKEFSIIEPVFDISNAVITINNADKYKYTGISQDVSFSVSFNDEELVLDTDYEIVSGNSGKNVDTYTLVIKGKGRFAQGEYASKTNSKEWTINKAELGVTWTNTSLTYTGDSQKPTATATGMVNGETVTLVVSGEQTNAGDNYTATAAIDSTETDNVNNYSIKTSDASKKFSIARVKVDLPTAITGLVFNNSEQTGVNAPGLDTLYTLSSGTMKATDVKVNYGRVDNYSAYFDLIDKNNYEWNTTYNKTSTKEVEWKIDQADVKVEGKTLTYNGDEQVLYTETPSNKEVVFKYASTSSIVTDKKDSDFKTDIPQGKDAGEYKYYYYINQDPTSSSDKAINSNYKLVNWQALGDKEIATTTIYPADLTSALGSFSSEEYDGQSHIPTITVKGVEKDNADLVLDKDYTVKYYDSNNTEISQAINAGTYKAVVTGKGNYSTASTKEVSWSITKTDTPAPEAKQSLQYNESEQDLVTADASLGYEYFVSNVEITNVEELGTFTADAKATNAGTYYVYWKSTGDSNHNAADKSLENVVEVTILEPTIDSVTVTGGDVDDTTFKYTSSDITPTIEVKAGEKPLASTDYELYKYDESDWKKVDSVSEKEVGEYTYKAKGILGGNYKGEKEFTFKIIPNISITINGTETTDDRSVTANVNYETSEIEISVTPNDNVYIEKVKVNESNVVKQEEEKLGASEDDGITLTYEDDGTANGSYSIENVKSGEYTIDVTATKVEAKSNPSVNFIKNIKTVTADEIVGAVIGEEYKGNGFDVKYDAMKMWIIDIVYQGHWKNLIDSLESGEHEFGSAKLEPNKEKVKITGADGKYAKVSIEKEITLVDDRLTTAFSFANILDTYTIPYNPYHTADDIKDHILEHIKLYDYKSALDYTEIPYDDEIKSYITVDLYKYAVGNEKADTIELNEGALDYNYTYVVLTLAPMYTESHHLKGCTSVSTLLSSRYKFDAKFDIFNYDDKVFTLSNLITENDKYYVNISANNTKSQYVSEIKVGDDTYDDELTYSNGKAVAKVEITEFEPEEKINVTRTLADAYTVNSTRQLAYISGVTVYDELKDLEKAVFDAIIDKDNTDIEFDDVSIEYLTYTNDWQKLDYEPQTVLGHKFGAQSSEQIRIRYKGNSEKYYYMNSLNKTGLTLETTLNIIDDRKDAEFVVDGVVEVNAADIDSDEPLYENLFDVIVDNVGLVDKENKSISLYDLFEENGLDIKDYLVIKDSKNNDIENILDLTPDVENTLNVKFIGIYDTENDIKYRECSASVKVKFNRYNTEMYFDTGELHEIEIVYDPEGATLANKLFKEGFIVVYNTDKDLVEVEFENTDIDYEPKVLDANILKTQDVTVTYKGDSLHKPCENVVAVRVFYAPSKISIAVEDKVFDNTPIDISYTTDPDGLHYAYMIAGLEGDVQGYISLYVDTSSMTFTLVNDPSTPLGKLSNWLLNNIINVPGSIFNGHYRDGVLYYGDAAVDLINKAFEEGNVDSIAKIIEDIINKAKELGVSDKFGDLENLLNLVDYIVGIREKYNITKVDFRLNRTPDQAGLYAVGAVTLQKNYVPAIDTKLFRIKPIILEPTWDEELPENKTIVLNEDGSLTFDFGADEFYETKHDEELGLDIKDETTYTTLYAGVKAATMPDIDFSSNTLLENLKEIIKKNTGLDFDSENIAEQFIEAIKNNDGLIYLSNKPCKEAGAYIEMVIFAGNYQATMTRAYIVGRNDTYLPLDNITCTYGDDISSQIEAGITVYCDDHSIDRKAIIKFVDLPDDTDIQDLMYLDYETLVKKLNILNPFVSDEIPTDAEKYLMVAYYVGNDIYKPTLSLKLLTIHKAKIHVSWSEDWANNNDGTISEDGYMLTYTYIDHNDTIDDKYIISKPDVYYRDLDNKTIELDIRNILYDTPSCDAGPHALEFVLSGTNADNYRIDNGITDPKYINMLGYTIIRKKISIGWKSKQEVIDTVLNHEDYDGVITLDGYNLTYTYRGQTDCGVDEYYKIDYSAFENDAEGVRIIVTGQNKNAGGHQLLFVASGKYSTNYDIDNGIVSEEIIDNTLAYEIIPVKLIVDWKQDIPDEVIDNVYTYTYNGNLFYLDDKFEIVNTEDILGDEIGVIAISGRERNVGKHLLEVALTGLYRNNYYLTSNGLLFLGVDTLAYEIVPKELTVEWTKVVFDVSSKEIKIPHYNFIGLVDGDKKPYLFFEFYDVDGNKIPMPHTEGIYLAKIIYISDKNYKVAGETYYVICDEQTLVKNPDYNIVAAALNDEVLKNIVAMAKLDKAPTYEQAISILSSLSDDALLKGFTDEQVDRIMTLLLEATHIDTKAESFKETKQLAIDKYGEGVFNKAFFLNIDLYAMVSGIIAKEKVTYPGYEVPVTIKISRDSEPGKLIDGNCKLYYVIRVHDGVVDRIPASVTRDTNGDFLLSFTSDRFSVFGIYTEDIPQPRRYKLPKTGVN